MARMTKSMPLADFKRLSPVTRAVVLEGLSGAIDRVAGRAPPSHLFLRQSWYAAAIAAYGGAPRTIVVECDARPVAALPLVAIGPAFARVATVPGCYWPFRGFPCDAGAGVKTHDCLLDRLAGEVNALRIGPAYDGDATLAPLLEHARVRGWAVLDRFVAERFLLDLTADGWPRGSTLRKNRFHEKHLAAHGALAWRFLGPGDWEQGFDALAAIEERSWIASRTDGRDAKFTRAGHGGFWREAARDENLARMMSGALLTIDGAPAACAFDLDCGPERYAVANSYDPAFAKHSPGRLLAYRNLMRARERGIRTVDWGAGDCGYKRTMGAVPGPAIRDWLLVRPGLPALIAHALKRRWAASGRQ